MPVAVSALVKEGVVAVLVAEGLAASSSPRRASVFGSGRGVAEETTREELRRWAIIIALGPITSSVYSGENKKRKRRELGRSWLSIIGSAARQDTRGQGGPSVIATSLRPSTPSPIVLRTARRKGGCKARRRTYDMLFRMPSFLSSSRSIPDTSTRGANLDAGVELSCRGCQT